jgi:formylglycine-generating enzyme required for sulfatase activity
MKPKASADEPKKLALVIGNSSYKDSPLRNPVNDARLISSALKKSGFEVISRINLDQRSFKEVIRLFGKRIRNASVALFYYAGHGIQVESRNYLVPIGTQIEKETDIENEAVDLSRVTAEFGARPNGMSIIILDACRNNPFPQSFRSTSRGLAQITAPAGTIIAYSTAPGMTASDGDGENGVYATALVAAILKGGLKIEDVFKQARAQVRTVTHGAQIPWESSSIIGDFIFMQGNTTNEEVDQQASISLNTKPYNDKYGVNWIFVSGGSLPLNSGDEKVDIDDFYISASEITFGQYDTFCESTNRPKPDDNGWGRGDLPVMNVNWNDANAYCEWLSQMTDAQIRLPYEVEWEYAARGGNRSKSFTYSGSDELQKVGWYAVNSGGRIHRVCSRDSNELGIFDMSGNVWEWCIDAFSARSQPPSAYVKPLPGLVFTNRVIRGGGWNSAHPASLGVMSRDYLDAESKFYACGFRVLKSLR